MIVEVNDGCGNDVIVVNAGGIQGPPGGFATGDIVFLTGLFYPLNQNPSGYLTPNQTGNFIAYQANNLIIANYLSYTGTTTGINLKLYKLIDTSNVTSVDWTARTLYDFFGISSVQWGNRIMTDSSNLGSLDWSHRQLKNGTPVALDWSNQTLIDNAATVSLDWNNRYLNGNWIGNFNNLTISGKSLITIDNTGNFVPTGQGANVRFNPNKGFQFYNANTNLWHTKLCVGNPPTDAWDSGDV